MVLQGPLRLLNGFRILFLIKETVKLAEFIRHIVGKHEKLLQATPDLNPFLVVIGKGSLANAKKHN